MNTQRIIPGMDDGKEFGQLKESMSRVGIDATDQVRHGNWVQTTLLLEFEPSVLCFVSF